MGSYYAGSTILINGKFPTHDPAEDGNQRDRQSKRRSKGKNKTSPSASASKKQKSKTKHKKALQPIPQGRGSKPRKLPAPEKMRKLTVRRILRQVILGIDVHVPNDISEDLREQILGVNSPEAWALAQAGGPEEYQRIKKSLEKIVKPVVEIKKKAKSKNIAISKLSYKIREQPENAKATQVDEQKNQIRDTSQYSLRLQKLRLQAITTAAKREKTGSKKTKLPNNLPSNLKKDIEFDGSLLAWAKNQPEYDEIFSKINIPEKKPKEEKEGLSSRQLMARGISRIILHDRQIPEVLLVEIIKSIGLLPTSPRFNVFAKGATKSAKVKAKNIWISSFDKAQMKAWSSLSKNQRNQYINTGRVDVGTPQIKPKEETERAPKNKKPILKSKKRKRKIKTLNMGSSDFILKQLRKEREKDFDYKKIDWDST